MAAAALAFGCGGDAMVGPVDEPALAAELEDAFSIFTSVAFGEVGRGVLYSDVLGGHGPNALAAHAGTVFRWDLEDQRYEPAPEPGLSDGVRFVLYAALEAVPAGAPLRETGSIDYLPGPGGADLRAVLVTETGARLDLDFAGEVGTTGAPHAWSLAGHVRQGGREYSFRSTDDVTPEDEGTSVRSSTWTGPDGLRVTYESRTTRITVFGGEDAHQELLVQSRHGRAEMIGRTVGGTGEHELALGGRPVAVIRQLSELRPDLIEAVLPARGTDLSAAEEAAARQIFRTRNHLSRGLIPLVSPVL